MPTAFAMRLLCALTFVSLWGSSTAFAQPEDAKPAVKPIKALLITGGCCHDYDRQKLIITKGTAARTNIEWTVVHQGGKTTNTPIPVYNDPDWAKGYDIVIHNECFAFVKDLEFVKKILKPHKEGTPAILIHCAMHCYRTGTNDWFEFCGVESPRHGAKYPYEVVNREPEHPAMNGFGKSWTTPKGELYHTVKLFPTAKTLATANRMDNGEAQTCIWANEYGENKTRVFGTTIGHYNEIMVEPAYLDMLTKGILWACKRDIEKEFHKASEEDTAEIKKLIAIPVGKIPTPVESCCREGNAAFEAKVSATSEEKSKNNFAKNAVDGNLSTRWCAAGSGSDQSLTINFEQPTNLKSVRLRWEKNAAYQYIIESTSDGKTWDVLVDQKENKKVEQICGFEVDAKQATGLRVTYFGSNTGVWASLWEVEAYSKKLPKLAKTLTGGTGKKVASVADVTAPEGFDVTMFGAPPEVNYPTCVAATVDGRVFVGVDEQGSLGKEKGRGKVLLCQDLDGDGKADDIKTFCKVDHPRGLVHHDNKLWVLHPPTMTLFTDDNRDGVADRSEVLLENISTEQVNKRGADHTTNNIRMGIDGWIYIAVGDFGFVNAKGTDGKTMTRRGGGVVRIQPDGTDMEIYAWGLRNIMDVGIDPAMNLFTRDNTNDGDGWDIRVSHIIQSGEYGYPSKYLNFAEEALPPLGDYGGGSGCGALYLHDARWPKPFGDAFYSCDWGRSEVYRHNLEPAGATFAPHQESFLKLPRPTDLDIDGRGRLFVASWKNGRFNYGGPDVGFVAMVTPQGYVPPQTPDFASLSPEELVAQIKSPSAVIRLSAQRYILDRGKQMTQESMMNLFAIARDKQVPMESRIAAVWTFKQFLGEDSHDLLLALTEESPELKVTVLRAVTDRSDDVFKTPEGPIVAALKDDDPAVVAQAIISAKRRRMIELVKHLLPLSERSKDAPLPTATPLHKQPDPARVIPHLAVQNMAAHSGNVILPAAFGLDGKYPDGAAEVLKRIHHTSVVDEVGSRLARAKDLETKQRLLGILIRLYYKEGEYEGDWWGTRPDNVGPYYDRQEWDGTDKIERLVAANFASDDETLQEFIIKELAKHQVTIKGISKSASEAETAEVAIKIPPVDPNNPNQIANMEFDAVRDRVLKAKGDIPNGKKIFLAQSCIACHTWQDGQKPKGPHLVDIGKRSPMPELIQSIVQPSAKLTQGFDSWLFLTDEGQTYTGFVVKESAKTIELRQSNGTSKILEKDSVEERVKQKISMMPKEVVGNLTPEQLADLIAFLQSLRSGS